MKLRALAFYACPSCKGDLGLTADSREGDEVLTGRLTCQSCHKGYPITRGVPRFVALDEYATSFGRQWNWFRKVQIDSLNGSNESAQALREATGWTSKEFTGALVLDAGVGAGRFAECAAAQGAEIVGVDISQAVDAAWENIGRHPRVHLAQADIFALPFKQGTFDLAYSIGVLHHTPDTEAAFGNVAATVKEGGSFAVYLYDRYGPHFRSSDLLRRVTTRLPHGLMWALTTVAIPLYYLYRIPVLGKLGQLAFPISMSEHWRWRWLDTFDWYTPKFQWKYLYPEVFRWYRKNGFHDVEIFDGPIRMRGVKAGHERPWPRAVRRHNGIARAGESAAAPLHLDGSVAP